LHFTAGGSSRDHFDHLAKKRYDDEHHKENFFLNCTPFWINRDGKIYQYFHPDYWAENSSIGIAAHQKNIAIEIVNWGYLKEGKEENDQISSGLYTYKSELYCLKNETDAYYDIQEDSRFGPEYRKQRYFAKFADEQYDSLRQLLYALCARYKIEYQFLPEDLRFCHASEFYDRQKGYFDRKQDGNGGYYYPPAQDFNGIFSHVNSDLGKYDIGPAFEWDRIIRPPLYYPYEEGKASTPTALWYHNTELRGEGGYYPVGRNQAVHPGVHLFSGSAVQAIRAMAPGHVAAWRFYTRSENYSFGKAREPLKMRHGKPGSFVLLRHDFKTREGEGETAHVIYSLYMDMDAEGGEIPWIKKLRDMATGNKISAGYDDAGALLPLPEGGGDGICTRPREEFSALRFDGDKAAEVAVNGAVQPGKVATLSDAVIPVEAGEVIGYTTGGAGGRGSNYFHWEVFTAEDNLFQELAGKCGIEGFNFRMLDLGGKDGVLEKDAAETFFGVPFSSLLGQWKAGDEEFRDYLNGLFRQKPETYSFTLKFNMMNGIRVKDGLSAEISAYAGDEALKIRLDGTTFTVSEPAGGGGAVNAEVALSRLCEGQYTVNACKKLSRISVELPGGFSMNYYAEKRKELFVEQAGAEGVFRNYLVKSVSPWTAKAWEAEIRKRQDDQAVDRGYSFSKNDFEDLILFDADSEYPLLSPIFGAGGPLDPAKEFTYIHPATFLWMLCAGEKNGAQFFNPAQQEENKLKSYGFIIPEGKNAEDIRAGDPVKLLVLAEDERAGRADPPVIGLPGQSIPVLLNGSGVFAAPVNTQYWGTYAVSQARPESINSPSVLSRFEIKGPVLKNPVLDAEARTVRVEFDGFLSGTILPLMQIRYGWEKEGSAPGMEEPGLLLVLKAEIGEGENSFSAGVDLDGIFNEIGPAEEINTRPIIQYRIVVLNGGAGAVLAALSGEEAKEMPAIVSGKEFVPPSLLDGNDIAASEYQDIDTRSMAPSFDGPAELRIDTTDNKYSVGAGLVFSGGQDIEACRGNPDEYFKCEIRIKSKKGENKIEFGSGTRLKVIDNELYCFVDTAPGYISEDEQELLIIFINKKGPQTKKETGAKIYNPIHSISAEFKAEPSGWGYGIDGRIDLDGRMIPGSLTGCRMELIWYYTRDGEEVNLGKSWVKDYGNKQIEGNGIAFSIPFLSVRGNAFIARLLTAGGGQIIADSPLCGGLAGAPVYGDPEKEDPFDGLRVIGDSKAKDGRALNARKRAENTLNGDRNLELGEKVWRVFDGQGKEIIRNDYIQAEIDKTDNKYWLIESRLERL
jgi:hypothetical protein